MNKLKDYIMKHPMAGSFRVSNLSYKGADFSLFLFYSLLCHLRSDFYSLKKKNLSKCRT